VIQQQWAALETVYAANATRVGDCSTLHGTFSDRFGFTRISLAFLLLHSSHRQD
jgi:hypothetical protein